MAGSKYQLRGSCAGVRVSADAFAKSVISLLRDVAKIKCRRGAARSDDHAASTTEQYVRVAAAKFYTRVWNPSQNLLRKRRH